MVKNWIAQDSVGNYLLEDLYMVTPPKMLEINSLLALHEVTIQLLDHVEYKIIATEANASFPGAYRRRQHKD